MEEELIESLEPLIKKMASKFYNVEEDDLLQVGKIGVINAYKHYDKNSNVKFSTFAYSYIFGEMYKLSLQNREFKTGRDNLKLLKLIEKTKTLLTQKLSREVTTKDLSTYLNIDESVISYTLGMGNQVVSLDKELEGDNLYNSILKEDDNDLRIDLINYISELDYPEKEIIVYRYFKGLTQSEIANILNMSQVSVSRYEKKTLSRIKKDYVCE